MKKIYLLAATALFALSANAQFTEGFESYDDGPIFTDLWTTWSGSDTGTENMLVSDEKAFEGAQSGLVAGGGAQDAVLDFPGAALTSGVYSLQMKLSIASGKTGYLNLQGNVDPNANAVQEFLSNNVNFTAGSMTINPGTDLAVLVDGSSAVSYTENIWFDVLFVVDLDAATYEVRVDGVSAGVLPAGATNYGGVDFFSSVADTNEMYVDNVVFALGELGADDFSADVFTVYPNPVVNTLNIRSAASVDNVTIYDVLGKQVLSVNPDAISPSVDMSNLSSGAYLVNVTIGNASKTIKVLK